MTSGPSDRKDRTCAGLVASRRKAAPPGRFHRCKALLLCLCWEELPYSRTPLFQTGNSLASPLPSARTRR